MLSMACRSLATKIRAQRRCGGALSPIHASSLRSTTPLVKFLWRLSTAPKTPMRSFVTLRSRGISGSAVPTPRLRVARSLRFWASAGRSRTQTSSTCTTSRYGRWVAAGTQATLRGQATTPSRALRTEALQSSASRRITTYYNGDWRTRSSHFCLVGLATVSSLRRCHSPFDQLALPRLSALRWYSMSRYRWWRCAGATAKLPMTPRWTRASGLRPSGKDS
mmetsp:Transcript_14000/g.44999  ORF Transcript_14000/g.44999 Transcript_14000/m.44999 type:complete len:221 (-) Transcript_14000:1422-2084(-)